jgi:HK97 family phage major capsid protein
MDFKEKLAEAARLFEEAKGILGNPQASAEDRGRVETLIENAKRLKAEAGQLKDVMAAAEGVAREIEEKQEPTRHKQSGKFAEWGEYLQAVYQAGKSNRIDPRLAWFDEDKGPSGQKDMVENVGASGGFLVPTEFLADLQAVMAETSIVRNRATIIRMRRRQIDLPVLDQTGSTANYPNWFGGMKFYWTEEAGSKTETDAKFRKVSLVAHKLIGYTRASDELVDDSAISLDDFLRGPVGFAGGVSWHEDFTFLQGTGAGQPLGVINAGATITVARAAQNAIGFADLANMMENFLPSARGVWIITQSAMADLIQMNGPAANPSYIWMPSARDGVPGYLLGLPVIWSEKVPRIGTAGDVVLADWRYYLIGDRQATTIESTKFDYWRYDETSWRVVHRVDGQPWLSQPLYYYDGTTRVSPFVILGDKTT